MLEALASRAPVLCLLSEVFILGLEFLLFDVHSFDCVLEFEDNFLFVAAALGLVVEVFDDASEFLFLVLDVLGVPLEIVMLLLFQFAVHFLVQAEDRVVELVVDRHDVVLGDHQMLVRYLVLLHVGVSQGRASWR